MALSVDVILPVHGGERWIDEAIASVLAQTRTDWHLYAVDDASPDASAARVERLAAAHPGRLTLLRLPAPRRAAGARMQAIAHGAGDVLAFLDQDDRWLPAKLERQLDLLERQPSLAAVHTDVALIDAEGARLAGAADAENARRALLPWGAPGPALAGALFDVNAIRLASAAVRRRAFEEAGGFDTALFGGEDWEFWVRFAHRFAIAHLAEVLVERRVHGANVSRVHARERALGKLRALAKLERELPWLGPRVPARRQRLCDQALGADDPQRALGLARRLFARLGEEGVAYCHWKSNEHLRAALAGRTDLDLLVDPAHRARLEGVLEELAMKRLVAPPAHRHPGMEHRLGLDPETGRLLHLHLHEQLVLGTPGAKEFRLPIEALLLAEARDLEGVRALSAELELVLLALRAPLKVSAARLARRWRRDGAKTLPSGLVREFAFLVPQVDEERLRKALARTPLALDADALLAFARRVAERRVTTPEIARARARAFRSLRPFRRTPAARAALQALRARLAGPRAKTLPGAGPIVALVGADGAGKSSLARDLRDWLAWKLLAEQVYLGIPKRPRLYRALRRARRRLRWDWLENERWLLVARHRVAEARRARRIAARGGVVLADRWPLPVLWRPPEPMDGPRLAGRGRAPAREHALYARIGAPTRTFALRAESAVLRERRPDVDAALHARKVEAVNALEESAGIAAVDANRPYPDVLLELKRRIWELL